MDSSGPTLLKEAEREKMREEKRLTDVRPVLVDGVMHLKSASKYSGSLRRLAKELKRGLDFIAYASSQGGQCHRSLQQRFLLIRWNKPRGR